MQKDADIEEYIVNENISLRLVRRRLQTYTMLMLGGVHFQSFNKLPIGVFINLPNIKDKIYTFDQDPNKYDTVVEAKEEFNKYCSIFKKWAENNYDVKIFNHHLTFPALKRLVELNDPLAEKVYPLHIINSIKTGNIEVLGFLILHGFLEDLTIEKNLEYFNSPTSDFRNNVQHAFEIEELYPFAFSVLKILLDMNIPWAMKFFTKNRGKIKMVLINQFSSPSKDERYRAASYFQYFDQRFENKEYSQIVKMLKIQDFVIKNLNELYDLDVEVYKKDNNYNIGLNLRYIIQDLIDLDDEKGVRKIYEMIKNNVDELEILSRTYLLSKEKDLVKYQDVSIPKCEATAIEAFRIGQKSVYKIKVQHVKERPVNIIDFDSYLKTLENTYEDYEELSTPSIVEYVVRDNHIHGLYIFYYDVKICDKCPCKSFKICYDECIYYSIPPYIGVLEHLEELIIFDARRHFGYFSQGKLDLHLTSAIQFLRSLKVLHIPKTLTFKLGSEERVFGRLQRQRTEVMFY